MSLDALVASSDSFRTAIRTLFSGDTSAALDQLNQLRAHFNDDSHSAIEIDRWIAKSLQQLGRFEDGLSLLRRIEPILREYQYDLSPHFEAVVVALSKLGRLEELRHYCESVRGSIRTHDALGHLDWMLVYSSAHEGPPSSFIYMIMAICAIQLGIDVPPRNISGVAYRAFLERLVAQREDGNRRFDDLLRQLGGPPGAKKSPAQQAIINRFLETESCPIFRDHAAEI